MVEPGPVLTGGRTIERELFIGAQPERVFRALTEPDQLERWFVTTAEGEARPGNALRYAWEGEGEVAGRYLEVKAPSRLVYEWYNPEGTTRITIRLTPEGDGTRLSLAVIGYGEGEDWDALYNGESGGWIPLLDALKTWVETGRERRRGTALDT